MSELTRLISRINKAILTQNSYIDSIRHPELLVESLEELNDLIGNQRVKDAVATQVSYLIAIKDSQNSDVFSPKEDRLMLNTILYGSPGVGKCLDPDEEVIMFDGSLKRAKDIQPCDLLMGEDSTPRKVLSVCSGVDNMYKIIPTNGEPFIVNEPHILTLICSTPPTCEKENGYRIKWYENGQLKTKQFIGLTPQVEQEALAFYDQISKKPPDVIDIPLSEYMKQSKSWKINYKGYHVGVEWKHQKVPFNPWVIGLFFGCNNSIVDIDQGTSRFKELQLNNVNVFQNTNIPDIYKINSRFVRLQLLAGLIDADGDLVDGCYEIVQKSKNLIDDIVFLSRSLGFCATKSIVDGIYYKCFISGEGLEEIPVLLERKKAKPKKHITNTSYFEFSVKFLGKGRYCGFTLDGNGRFLLKDFTVTHNTLVGTKLAKIWYSLGFLDGSRRKISITPEEEREKEIKEIIDIFDKIKEEKGFNYDEQLEDMADMVRYAVVATILLSTALSLYKSYGIYWAVIVILVVILSFLMMYYEYRDDSEIIVEEEEIEEVEDRDRSKTMPPDEDIITVVSRADFVGKYVGWSDKKTLKLLNDNLGKVLFVDEAYSLVTNGRDTFGIEVLNTINLFLSEHPGEIIVIFAGYKDLMESGIFSFQPGLSRRFMWHFECDGYSYQELFKIFNLQLEKTGWGLTNYGKTKRVFRKYKDSFPNFGGDTERLTFFAKLEHSREYIDDECFTPNKLLTPKHIRRGIKVLKKNNIKNASPHSIIKQLSNL